jgi:hypothetical protein
VVLDGISLQVPGSWRVPAENQQFPMPCGPNAARFASLDDYPPPMARHC